MMLAISGGIDVMLADNGAGAELNAPCTPPPTAKTQLGQEVRVTDGDGIVLGTGKIEGGITRGHALVKGCSVDFSFKVPGTSENYQLIIGSFEPMPYTREDIRRGLSFYETEQGTLAVN
ncbi:hypothetical protein [Streptomyces sp. NPDC055607]